MAVTVHETGYGKWKVPVIIIAAIIVICLAGAGILLKDSLGVTIEEGSRHIEVAEGDGTSSVAQKLHGRVSIVPLARGTTVTFDCKAE